jgi:hypothetical protein
MSLFTRRQGGPVRLFAARKPYQGEPAYTRLPGAGRAAVAQGGGGSAAVPNEGAAGGGGWPSGTFTGGSSSAAAAGSVQAGECVTASGPEPEPAFLALPDGVLGYTVVLLGEARPYLTDASLKGRGEADAEAAAWGRREAWRGRVRVCEVRAVTEGGDAG